MCKSLKKNNFPHSHYIAEEGCVASWRGGVENITQDQEPLEKGTFPRDYLKNQGKK